jgi:hypothetical protein
LIFKNTTYFIKIELITEEAAKKTDETEFIPFEMKTLGLDLLSKTPYL